MYGKTCCEKETSVPQENEIQEDKGQRKRRWVGVGKGIDMLEEEKEFDDGRITQKGVLEQSMHIKKTEGNILQDNASICKSGKTTTLSPNRPTFFKVLVNDFSTGLEIPWAFVMKYKYVPYESVLLLYQDKQWRLDVEMVGERVYFKGLERFVEDNSLKIGDFLIFKYVENSTLKVKMYGKALCEEEVQVVKDQNSEPVLGKESRRQENDQRKRKVIHIDSDSYQNGESKQSMLKQRRKLVSQETASNHKIQKNTTLPPHAARKFNSQHPYFQVKLTATYASNGYLPIPAKIFKDHLKAENREITLQMLGKNWTVMIRIYGRSSDKSKVEARINGGWGAFVRDNGLKAGDICIFRMIRSDDIVFKVHVNRCNLVKSEIDGRPKHCKSSDSSVDDQNVEFNSPYPSFHVQLTSTYIRTYMMIPKDFFIKYMKEGYQKIKVEMRGKFWTLECNSEARITGRWRRFVRENGLKKGDVCTFIMTKSDGIEFEFKLHVQRL
ncbi:hypothetical protein L6164_000289 [Bauhinia variegata]|uniref:Uncharacterized protein n=1 Tax=Bauhinia variegata TaxID=167791 RepID=A0ACB9QBN9_BAUVA|nr:hypothetical protein L6164_000289 [Bauhinia variegata]